VLPVTAVIELSFSPVASIGGVDVRLETLALAAVIAVALLLAVLATRSTPVDLGLPTDALDEDGEPNHLRADDLLYVAVAALPGAVVGGRLGYVLLHLDYYTANQGAVLDIGQGGFELALAVVGGTLTAAIVATMLGGSVGRWMSALILPLLLALAGGKLALVLGGNGQGLPWDGRWATAYLGPGPWGSLAPAIPSHPAQVYEAVATTLVLLVLMMVLAAGAFQRRGAGVFLLGIALWALARAAVATTWRDPAVIGELNMGQVIALGVAAGALLLLAATEVVAHLRRRRPAGAEPAAGESRARPEPAVAPPGTSAPDWPDPATRPRL
jgi:phosphatidylglycerol:prolipoprotein diacylglycerol transferase